MCCTLWLSTPVPPKEVLEYPLLYIPLLWYSVETHGRQRELEIATVRFGLRDLVAYSSDAI
jgi:hypothetical protein